MHKVCLFTDTLGDLNGVSRFIQDMGELAFQDSAFDLQIATCTSKTLPGERYIRNLPYRFRVPMPFYQELDLVWPKRHAIKAYLESEEPDSVHISTPGPFGWMAKQVAQELGYPLIGTYHTDFSAYIKDLSRSDWMKQKTDQVMAHFYQSFEHVFSRSKKYKTIMHEEIKIPLDKISTLKAGTQLEHFHPKHHNPDIWPSFGLSKARLKVLYVGRINIEKSIPFLLDVWKQFTQQHPEIEADLILVGEGRYRKLANKMKPFNAYFLGPIRGQTLNELYASSHVFAFPSLTDTLGQVIMESQASGLGCLVSDMGGPQSLIINNQTGKILPKNSDQAWLEGLKTTLTNPDLIQRWSEQSRGHMLGYDIHDSYRDFKQQHCNLGQ
ncbi:MAG: glycosyltransferase [Pseudomonadota bacterium]|nr:glycosyltransferase [Pseudomonadota bacterium]